MGRNEAACLGADKIPGDALRCGVFSGWHLKQNGHMLPCVYSVWELHSALGKGKFTQVGLPAGYHRPMNLP